MKRYLVVAHQTLDSPGLLDAIRARQAAGAATFHLLVPELHGNGGTWNEGQVRAEAERVMEEARLRLTALGVAVTGEVGHTDPADAVGIVLRRDGAHAYDGIIISTLPRRISRWLGLDAPTRVRKVTDLPVEVVEAALQRSAP